MSDREAINPSGKVVTKDDLKETRSQIKARIAQVLSRGQSVDVLKVPLPDDLYGEWVPRDPLSMADKEMLGFRQLNVDDVKVDLNNRPYHNDGTGALVLGDVVFMTIPKIEKEIIDEVRMERYKEANSPKKEQLEEKNFRSDMAGTGLPVISESKATPADTQHIKDAITP